MQRLNKHSLLMTAALVGLSGAYAEAQSLQLIPGPTYDGTTAGGQGGVQATATPTVPRTGNSNAAAAGISIGTPTLTSAGMIFNGFRSYPNTTAGGAPVADSNNREGFIIRSDGTIKQLDALPNAFTPANASAPGGIAGNLAALSINYTAGLVSGYRSVAFSATGGSQSTKATVWDSSTGAATQLLDLNPTYDSSVNAYTTVNPTVTAGTTVHASSQTGNFVNITGVVAGSAATYKTSTGATYGTVGIRWNSVTSTPNILTYGTATGSNSSSVVGIDNSGNVVGTAGNYTTGSFVGTRAVIWDSSTTAGTPNVNSTPTVLPTIYTGVNSPSDTARVVNGSGVVGGNAQTTTGYQHAVRWNTTTGAPDDLVGIGQNGSTSTAGNSGNDIFGINKTGDVVGVGGYYATAATTGPTGIAIAQYASLGARPTLWKSGSITPIPLGIDGVSTTGTTSGGAYAINDSGLIVGKITKYSSTGTVIAANVAALWDSTGNLTEFNTLFGIDPANIPTTAAGFTNLTEADGITNNGWVSGFGTYDADGSTGAAPAYTRAFLIQVPEPTSLAAVAMLGLVALRRRRTV